jgi:hypothetical protein
VFLLSKIFIFCEKNNQRFTLQQQEPVHDVVCDDMFAVIKSFEINVKSTPNIDMGAQISITHYALRCLEKKNKVFL